MKFEKPNFKIYFSKLTLYPVSVMLQLFWKLVSVNLDLFQTFRKDYKKCRHFSWLLQKPP